MDIPPPFFSEGPVTRLLHRGVVVPHPESVFVDEDVDSSQIAPGVVLHPGTRLHGASLSIGPGCVIGGETPATVVGCQLGHDVALKGGYFEGSVFLDESACGSSAHVRPGCLLEEEASAAHAVGLKQTILFPWVTLGSLVNFCDVLMSGGTSRKHHSEVGSSFIHFNFTPHGDKATPSLLGDVPRGVLLDQPPVFLGGQGGIVGPSVSAFGVVQAAGTVCRSDMEAAGHLYVHPAPAVGARPYQAGAPRAATARLRANLLYIGNLFALQLWYRSFRKPLLEQDAHREACRLGAITLLRAAVGERTRQLERWAALLDETTDEDASDVARRWPAIREALRVEAESGRGDAALEGLAAPRAAEGKSLPAAVASLSPEERRTVVSRLETEVQRAVSILDRAP